MRTGKPYLRREKIAIAFLSLSGALLGGAILAACIKDPEARLSLSLAAGTILFTLGFLWSVQVLFDRWTR